MKKIILYFLTVLFVNTLYSQKLKFVQEKNRRSNTVKEFYILKESKQKQGDYLKKRRTGEAIVKGFYKKGKKDSIWVYYCKNGLDTLRFGKFYNNKKEGVWIENQKKILYYYIDNEIKYEYNLNEDIIKEYYWGEESDLYDVKYKRKWIKKKVDNPPLIINGESPFDYIPRIDFWKMGFHKDTIGAVIISVEIDMYGKMSNIQLKQGFSPEIDKIFIQAVKQFDKKWYSARINSEPVTVKKIFVIPLNIKWF